MVAEKTSLSEFVCPVLTCLRLKFWLQHSLMSHGRRETSCQQKFSIRATGAPKKKTTTTAHFVPVLVGLVHVVIMAGFVADDTLDDKGSSLISRGK